MKHTMRFSVGGQTVDVPNDELEQFRTAAAEHGATPDEVKSYRVDGKDVEVPDSQYEQFSAMAKEHGATPQPLRRISFADGSTRDFTMPELSKFLRSKEWREDERYAADREERDKIVAERTNGSVKDADSGFLSAYGDGLADSGGTAIGRTLGGALSRFAKFMGMAAAYDPQSQGQVGYAPEELRKENPAVENPTQTLRNNPGMVIGDKIDKATDILFPNAQKTDSTVAHAVGKAVGLGTGLAEFALTPAPVLAGGHFAEGWEEAFDVAKARGATDEEAMSLGLMRAATDAAVTTAFKNAPVHRIMKAFGYAPKGVVAAAIEKAGEKGVMGVSRGGVAAAVGKQMLANAAIGASEMGVLGGLQGFIDDAIMQEAEKGEIDWGKSWKTLGNQFLEQGAFGAVMALLPTPLKVREAVKARDAILKESLSDPMGVVAYAHANPEAGNMLAQAWRKEGKVSRKVARDAGLPSMDETTRNGIGETIALLNDAKAESAKRKIAREEAEIAAQPGDERVAESQMKEADAAAHAERQSELQKTFDEAKPAEAPKTTEEPAPKAEEPPPQKPAVEAPRSAPKEEGTTTPPKATEGAEVGKTAENGVPKAEATAEAAPKDVAPNAGETTATSEPKAPPFGRERYESLKQRIANGKTVNIEGFPKGEALVIKDGNRWIVVDGKSGMRFGEGRLRKDAIKAATRSIREHGKDDLDYALKTARRDFEAARDSFEPKADGEGEKPTGKEPGRVEARTPEEEIEERLDLRRLDPKRRSDPKVLEWAKKQGRTVTDGMATPDAVRAYDEAMTEAAAKVVNKRWFPDMKIVTHKYGEKIKRGQHVLEQIGGIYTGTASDYANRSRRGGVDDGPSLKKIGTGEGSQVYGWGLYGSNVRGVAEGYAAKGSGKSIVRKKGTEVGSGSSEIEQIAKAEIISSQGVNKALSRLKDYIKGHEGDADYDLARSVIREIENGDYDISSPGNLYEQTFFTDRAPGDESHLLKWYEDSSSSFVGTSRMSSLRDFLRYGDIEENNKKKLREVVKKLDSYDPVRGHEIYEAVAYAFGHGINKEAPRKASEWFAAHGIDGVKYPVDSFGGKGVKDGDVAGWNYVSFRDDNIRVDHKWRDGELQYLRDTAGRTLGWFDPKSKEVHLLPGADPQTVAHEIMWHGTRQYMTERAAKGDARAQKFLDMMHDVEKNAPQDIKDIVNRLYMRGGVPVDRDTLLNEYGAWFTMRRGGYALEKAMQKAENRNWFAKGLHAVKEMFKDFLIRHGRNRVDISKVDGMTRDEFVDFLADQFASGKTLGNIKEDKPALSTKETWWQKMRRRHYDQNAAVRDLQRDVEKLTGRKIAEADNVEMANALKYGLKEAANMDIQGRMRTLREKLHDGGIHFADLEYYAACKAAAGRDAKIDKRNLDKLEADMKAQGATPDEIDAAKAAYRSSNGSHIDPREARRVVAEIESGSKAQAYKDALAELRKTIDETLQTQVDAGLVSKESAAQWRAEEPDYVPFKNEYDPENGGWNGRGSSMSNFVAPEHRMAKGRQSAAGDIIAHVFMDHQAARHRAIENAVRQKLAKLVKAHPELGKVEKLKADAVKNVEQSDPNVVIFKQGGDSYAIRLEGTRGAAVANAFTGRETLDMKWADKGFSVFGKKISFRNFTRWSAGMATRYSPTFALRNTLKDNIELANIVYSERGPLAGSAWMGKYVANRAKMAKTLAKYVATGKIDTASAEGAILDRYIKAGGLIAGGTRSEAFASIKDRLDPKAIEKEMRRGKSKVKAAGMHVLKSVAYLNEYAEMATRVGIFATEVKGGKSDAEAALFSRRATVDFNRHGDWTPGFNLVRMFSNSTLGATARAAAALGKSKYGMVATGMMFANGLAQSLINYYANADEDKERAKRGEATGKDVSEFDRRTSLFYFRSGDKLYRIAQHESPFSLIKYAGDCVGRWLCGEISGKQMAKNLRVNAAEIAYNFLPMGSINLTSRKDNLTEDFKAAIVSGIVPSALQPIAEIAFDMDFKGDPVTKKLFDDFASRSHNGKSHTPSWAKATAEWIQEHTGGNAGNHKGLDVAPEVIQKLVEGYGKNLLKDVSTAFSVGEAIVKNDYSGLDPRNTPVKRDFVRPLDGNTQRYYSAMGNYKGDRKELLAMIPNWTAEEHKAFVKEHPWAAAPEVDKMIQKIGELQKLEDGYRKADERGKWVKAKEPPTEEQKEKWKAARLRYQAKFLEIAEKHGGVH